MKFKPGRKNMRFLLFLLVVHAAFFAVAITYKHIYTGDSFEYIYMALNIKEHFWFYSGNPALPVVPEYLTLRPPLYPLFLMLVYVFTVNNWVVLVLQNLLSVFNVLYLRDTIRILGYKRKYDYLLMALVMLYPSQFVNANMITPDLLLQTCVLMYVRHFIRLLQDGKWRHAYWMSLALIAGLMLKPVWYLFVPLHCFIVLFAASYLNRGILRSALAATLPIFVVLVYMQVNGYRTGKVHFSSTQSFNAVYYYYFYFSDKEGLEEAEEFLQKERAAMDAIPEYKDRYEYANRRGIELLKQHFAPYMLYHIKHSARLLIDPGKGEWDMFTGKLSLGGLYSKKQTGFYATLKREGLSGIATYVRANPSMAMVMIVLLFNILRLAGLIVFMADRRIILPVRLLALMLIGYFCMTTGPIANPRYFIPVSLLAIGCAALGFQRLLRRRKNKTIIAAEQQRLHSFA